MEKELHMQRTALDTTILVFTALPEGKLDSGLYFGYFQQL